MRAITVRQPWAWAIIHGGKDVENRSRNIAGGYRGPVAIHAGLQVADETDTPERWIAKAVGELARNGQSRTAPMMATDPDTPDHQVHERYGWRGAIIGVVDLVGVHEERPYWSSRTCYCPSDWAEIDCWHLMLRNPRPLATPIPCRGRLGLWTVPDEIAAQIEVAA